MKPANRPVTILAAILVSGVASLGADRVRVLTEPQLERPTLHSLGVYWILLGDDNRNASVLLEFRKAGAARFTAGAPLVRVERKAHLMGRFGSRLEVPEEGCLFAGSVLHLEPATAYELRLTLVDPDQKTKAAATSRVLKAQTRAEPRVSQRARERHVVPGTGGGTGTAADPFRGLTVASKAAAPGDLFLLHSGVYQGPWVINRSGTDTRPIVWRGQVSNGESGSVVIDGQGHSPVRPAHAIEASGTHDVWIEDLTVQNAMHGVTFHDAARIVVRRCHIRNVEYGMNAARNTEGIAQDHFIADNVIEGPSTWPRTKGIENARGIQITGTGHVVCYNRIRGFADAIDTMPSPRCSAIDIHNNELSELTDDGIELDFSQRNTRCFWNRLTNVFQGISMQPVYGGPVYVFRNMMYNVAVETFKMHNSPSGCLIFHNTSVKNGTPLLVWTPEPVRHSMSRNNLFIGTAGDYAFDTTAPMVNCDFDYEGFGGGPFRLFLRWNRTRYATLDEVRSAPVEKHAILVENARLFALGALPPFDVARPVPLPVDLRLKSGSAAIDAGAVMPGLNDGFRAGRTWARMSTATLFLIMGQEQPTASITRSPGRGGSAPAGRQVIWLTSRTARLAAAVLPRCRSTL